MPSTKHVVVGGTSVTLYSKDGRNWDSSPYRLQEYDRRHRAEGEDLRRQWHDGRLLDGVLPAPDDPVLCGGKIDLVGIRE